MGSLAVGTDHESAGAETPTAAQLRTYTDDQSGGTDSGDARQVWDRAYGWSLTVRDGYGFDDALEDLRAGRLVHLDVWARTMGGCLSGSGEYGHTVAVLPDLEGSSWLVSDPWCSPAKWQRIAESKLRAGAEEWGRRVFTRTTGGGRRGSPAWRLAFARAARAMMTERHPGNVSELPPAERDPGDTGGAEILFTATHPQPLEGETMGPTFTPSGSEPIGTATTTQPIGIIPTSGAEFHQVAEGYARHVYELVTITSGPYDGEPAYLVQVPSGRDEMGLLLAKTATYVPLEPEPGPDPVDELEIRRDQWELDATSSIGPRP
jgi:hypothetical protein